MKISKSVKVSVLMVSSFVAAFSWAAPEDWSDMKGCYSTVTFNGQPTGSTANHDGRAELEDKFFYATMPGVDHIRAFQFLLLKYRIGSQFYADYVWIFLDYGTTTVSPDGKWTWAYNGPMICTGLCRSPTPFTMNTRIEISKLGPDLYQIHNMRTIPELPDRSMDSDDVYVVKKKTEHCSVQ